MKFLSGKGRRSRRLVAAVIGAQAFCALASGFGVGGSTAYRDYFVLLAVVYAPVAFVWCNAIRDFSPQPKENSPTPVGASVWRDAIREFAGAMEGIGWTVLLLFWVVGCGSV